MYGSNCMANWLDLDQVHVQYFGCKFEPVLFSLDINTRLIQQNSTPVTLLPGHAYDVRRLDMLNDQRYINNQYTSNVMQKKGQVNHCIRHAYKAMIIRKCTKNWTMLTTYLFCPFFTSSSFQIILHQYNPIEICSTICNISGSLYALGPKFVSSALLNVVNYSKPVQICR